MPFTFSHPAAVLPFSYLPKKWVSLTALVIGSMTPDFEYFIRMKVSAKYSHGWVGMFWFDLPLALLLLWLYNTIIKDKLIDHMPAYFNKQLSAFKNSGANHTRPAIIAIVFSAVIGIASHLLWDSFTHPMGYFVKHHHILSRKVSVANHFIQTYNILQHLSTLVGFLIILYAIAKLPVGKLTSNRKGVFYYWLKITGIAATILAIRLLLGLSLKEYGDVIVTGISGMLIGLVIVSAITSTKQRT